MVPEVYMIVHRSSGLGGMGAAGLARPSSRNSSNEWTAMPRALVAAAAAASAPPHTTTVLTRETTAGRALASMPNFSAWVNTMEDSARWVRGRRGA